VTTVDVLGVDLGGTNLRAMSATVSPLLGATIGSEHRESVSGFTPRRLIRRLRELADELCSEPPAAVAIGIPGPVSSEGEIGHLVNLPDLDGAFLGAMAEAALDVPIVVENDVNLAALGEQRHGHARTADDVAFIAVGTGVGMGIVTGRRILRGARGAAGELGVLWVPQAGAGNHGAFEPLEAVAGGAALAEHWSAHTGTPATGDDVFSAATGGDGVARELLSRQARALADAVRCVHGLLDPELIVFGGGIGSRPDVIASVRAELAGESDGPVVIRSALGPRAGLYGAVEAAITRVARQQPANGEVQCS
jgi:predicted NBD/HSP70 family sugar kinase